MTLPGRRLFPGVLLLAAFVVAGCSEPTAPPIGLQVAAFALGDPTDNSIVAGEVKVCKVGPAGTYSFSATKIGTAGMDGTLLTPFDVDAGACRIIWTTSPLGAGQTSQPRTAVTVTETVPNGFQLDSIEVLDPVPETPSKVYDSNSATSDGNNYFHGSVVIFYNSEIPPPPPECHGLTPGYWKNWPNHYTAAQFDELIGLLPAPYSGMTAEQIVAILSYGGPDPVFKLLKFYVSNLLTQALSTTNLPNPSGGDLGPDCQLHEGSITLGEAMAMAADILANPGNYKRSQINAVKDILDAFANLNDD